MAKWLTVEKRVEELLSFARSRNLMVIHVRADYSPEKSPWFPRWDEMNRLSGKGTMGVVSPDDVCSFAKELEGEHIIAKPTFDGFLNTSLESLLKDNGITEILVGGIVTSCCVLLTAVRSLYLITIEAYSSFGRVEPFYVASKSLL